MRSLATLLTLPFAASGILSATPRIEQISPNAVIAAARYQFADVDGNGFEDLVGECPYGYWTPDPIIIRNMGNRTFSRPEQSFYFQLGDPPDKNFTLIELTGPGDYRMLLNRGRSDSSNNPVTPLVIPLDQPGTFGERTALAPEGPRDWLPVDLDGDHQSEFIYAQPTPDDKTELTIQDRQPDGSYTPTKILLNSKFDITRAIAVDLDDDSDLDLVLYDTDSTRLLRRTGTRSFEAEVRQTYLLSPQVNDLDGDGLPDLHSNGSEPFEWVINYGDFFFSTLQSRNVFPDDTPDLFSVIPRTAEPAILEFKAEKNNAVSLKSVHFGEWDVLSETTIDCSSMNPPLPGSQGFQLLARRDLDKDGHPDFVFLVAHVYEMSVTYNKQLAVAWGTADGPGTPAFVHPTPIHFEKLIVADFNSQNGPDIIGGPDADNHHWFFANDGTGKFASPVKVTALDLPPGCPPGTRISSIKQADFNNDGIPDLAIGYSRSYQGYFQTFCCIAPGNGDGTFVNPALPPGAFDTLVSTNAEIDHIIDWDGDGDLDIIGNGEWRENINGIFALESIPLIDGASLTDILGNPIRKVHTRVGDVDGDGHPDIISLTYRFTDEKIEGGIVGGLGGNYESVIGIGFNDGLGGIEEIAEIPVTMHMTDLLGNPMTLDLRIADVNGDGRMDICHHHPAGTDIFGNPLTTSKWRRNPGGAASRNPALWISLPYGSHELPDTPAPELDFDGDGRKDWATPNGYVRPGPSGPVVSATYDFTGSVYFGSYDSSNWHVADFDGDGDTDTLYTDRYMHLSLVRNPLVDERSPITRHLVAAGSTGQKAQPLSDADGDGRDNQTELLFGTDPLSKDNTPANPLGVHLIPGGSGNALQFQLPDYASELGLHYDVEHSTNLVDWAPLDGVSPDLISNNAGWNRMNLPLECSGPCGYFRIRGSHRTE